MSKTPCVFACARTASRSRDRVCSTAALVEEKSADMVLSVFNDDHIQRGLFKERTGSSAWHPPIHLHMVRCENLDAHDAHMLAR